MRSYLYKKGRIIKWTLLIFLTHLQLSEEGCQWCSFLLVKISLYTENSRWIRSIGQDLENIMLLSWKCHFLCRRYSLGSPERFLFLPDSNESSYKFLPFNLFSDHLLLMWLWIWLGFNFPFCFSCFFSSCRMSAIVFSK